MTFLLPSCHPAIDREPVGNTLGFTGKNSSYLKLRNSFFMEAAMKFSKLQSPARSKGAILTSDIHKQIAFHVTFRYLWPIMCDIQGSKFDGRDTNYNNQFSLQNCQDSRLIWFL